MKRKNDQPQFLEDDKLAQFVNDLTEQRETFIHFPLNEQDVFILSPDEVRHVQTLLNKFPKLQSLKRELCPVFRSDSEFWSIYFTLLRHYIFNMAALEQVSPPVEFDNEEATPHKIDRRVSLETMDYQIMRKTPERFSIRRLGSPTMHDVNFHSTPNSDGLPLLRIEEEDVKPVRKLSKKRSSSVDEVSHLYENSVFVKPEEKEKETSEEKEKEKKEKKEKEKKEKEKKEKEEKEKEKKEKKEKEKKEKEKKEKEEKEKEKKEKEKKEKEKKDKEKKIKEEKEKKEKKEKEKKEKERLESENSDHLNVMQQISNKLFPTRRQKQTSVDDALLSRKEKKPKHSFIGSAYTSLMQNEVEEEKDNEEQTVAANEDEKKNETAENEETKIENNKENEDKKPLNERKPKSKAKVGTKKTLSEKAEKQMHYLINVSLESQRLASKAMKLHIRSAMDIEQRNEIWSFLTGCKFFMTERPLFYQNIVEKNFGMSLMNEDVDLIPFNAHYKEKDHFLNHSQSVSLHRIIYTIRTVFSTSSAWKENNVDIYLPFINDLVSLLLSSIPEDKTFLTTLLILEGAQNVEENDASSNQSLNSKFLPTNEKENNQFSQSFMDLVEKILPKVFKFLKKLNISNLDFAIEWFDRLFVGSLQLDIVKRVFDCYISEGKDVLIRVGLALLKDSITLFTPDTTSSLIFFDKLKAYTLSFNDANLVLKTAFAFQISDSCAELEKEDKEETKPHTNHNIIARKNSLRFHEMVDKQLNVFLGKPDEYITNQSKLLSDTQMQILQNWLPYRYRIRQPNTVFFTAVDGFNLKTLYLKSQSSTGLILLIRTMEGRIFGFFTTDQIRITNGRYAGTGEGFLFRLGVTELKKQNTEKTKTKETDKKEKANKNKNENANEIEDYKESKCYVWQPGNVNYFLLVESKFLAIGGGGGFGLTIDEQMNGSSAHCQTFDNEPLNGKDEQFVCAHVEVMDFGI